MYTFVLICCIRLAYPFDLHDNGQCWNENSVPKWRQGGEVAVGLLLSQTNATQYFIRQCKNGKCLSAAFSLNFHFGKLTSGHMTGLRQLLLISGDVESNPGPVNESQDQPSTSGAPDRLKCHECEATFGQKKNRDAHIRNCHGTRELRCTKLGCSFTTSYGYNLKRHLAGHENQPTPKRQRLSKPGGREGFAPNTIQTTTQCRKKGATALKGRLRAVQIAGGGADPLVFLNDTEKEIRDEVTTELAEKTGIKLQVMLGVNFYKVNKPQETKMFYFWSKQMAIYRGTNYKLDEQFAAILSKVDKALQGSDWVIKRIDRLEIHLAKCQPLRGSTYVKLPPYLENKKAIINVKNSDKKCFVWSILAQLKPAPSHVDRVSNYVGYEDRLNMSGIELPVAVSQIDKFERQNCLAVNVYCFDGEYMYPRRISDSKTERHVHLLLHEDHYSLIKDLNKLLYDQNMHRARKFFCPRCLIPSSTSELLAKHMELCGTKDPTRITMPEESVLKFKNVQRQLRQPLVVYADFECLIEKQQEPMETDEPIAIERQHHIPCGYGLVEARNCCGTPNFDEPRIYRGQKTVDRFLTDVVGIAVEHQKTMENQKEMGELDEERQQHDTCHVCGESIEKDKVRDHCHLCGRYRGPAHRECNSGYRLNRDVVVVFHNLRKYDGHLIMQELGNVAKMHGYEIEVVAKAMEDYISFSLVHQKERDSGGPKDHGYKIKFIDSLQFLNNSLEGLVKNMDKDQFHAMATQFSEQDLKLLLRKGVYPYEYMDSWQKFEAPLPPKANFYSSLKDEHITDADYAHAEAVWNHFGIHNMGDYHDLYLKTDVILLADVFEGFRQFGLEKYGLDPCHYLTTPSLAWDSCLKMTKVELEMLDDVDKYLFCENGIRGGISMISHRHAVANNPMVPGFDEAKPRTHIMYWDANNLYGWAMVQKLPVDGFRWMEEAEMGQDWQMVDTEGDKGYILEVDLEYPNELHDAHDKYPLAPESMEITNASPYCQELKEKMDIKVPTQRKLVPHLGGRKKYILHFRNLKLYLQLGMKLIKVHRGLQFNQRAWMEPYIMFNTRMRALATSEFDKNLLKLFNNAVFGKTMENVRKYKNIELVTSEAVFEKRVANHRYERSCRFNENLVGVAMLRPSTCLCKPIYCGLTVLDLSKELMYRFHYEYIVPKYGPQATLLFTDTDSLCYSIETDDIYKDMSEDSDRFDFSDYPKDHSLYSTNNKKVIGKMKDELSGVPVQAFCGLRPKMYALIPDKRRAKGIKKSVVKKEITFQDYVDTLFGETFMRHSMTVLQNKKHEVYTKTITKKSLCAYDDKRWLLNATTSRARGHYLNTIHPMVHQDV